MCGLQPTAPLVWPPKRRFYVGAAPLLASALVLGPASLAVFAQEQSESAAQPAVAGETQAGVVFQKWLSWQRVYADQRVGDPGLLDSYLDNAALRDRLSGVPESIQPQLKFLRLPANANSIAGVSALSAAEVQSFGRRFRALLERFNTTESLSDWIEELKQARTGFTSVALNSAEEAGSFRAITKRYREFVDWLSAPGTRNIRERRRFAIANRFYEYAFAPESFGRFRELTEKPVWRPIARMLYANIWYNLSGNGWRNWHANTLERLRTATARGKEIVYIAGGSDIYLPLRYGAYNLRVIDPMLPSQTKYYSEGWQLLTRGRVGDVIRFDLAAEQKQTTSGLQLPDAAVLEFRHAAYMRRTRYAETGSFQTGELSNGRRLTLPLSETVWEIFDAQNRRLGRFVLERRFVTQDDFRGIRASEREYLISFNELYFITAAGRAGWGIDPRKFDSGIRMHVKQLRRPVDRTTMANMRAMNAADFYYIKLGTSVD